MRAREVPHLHLPGAVVAGILVHEDHRGAASGLFIIKPRPVVRGYVRHHALQTLLPIICTQTKAE